MRGEGKHIPHLPESRLLCASNCLLRCVEAATPSSCSAGTIPSPPSQPLQHTSYFLPKTHVRTVPTCPRCWASSNSMTGTRELFPQPVSPWMMLTRSVRTARRIASLQASMGSSSVGGGGGLALQLGAGRGALERSVCSSEKKTSASKYCRGCCTQHMPRRVSIESQYHIYESAYGQHYKNVSHLTSSSTFVIMSEVVGQDTNTRINSRHTSW